MAGTSAPAPTLLRAPAPALLPDIEPPARTTTVVMTITGRAHRSAGHRVHHGAGGAGKARHANPPPPELRIACRVRGAHHPGTDLSRGGDRGVEHRRDGHRVQRWTALVGLAAIAVVQTREGRCKYAMVARPVPMTRLLSCSKANRARMSLAWARPLTGSRSSLSVPRLAWAALTRRPPGGSKKSVMPTSKS